MIKEAYVIEFFYDETEELEKCCDIAKSLGGDCFFQISLESEAKLKSTAKAVFNEEGKLKMFKKSLGL